MRKLLSIVVLTGVATGLGTGCSANRGNAGAQPGASRPRTSAPASQPSSRPAKQPAGQRETLTEKPPAAPAPSPMTATNNPTTLAGRGTPSLDDAERPAAWIYIDGRGGHYIDHDGHPQVQWLVEEPASRTPTFRVEAYTPLLGTPRDIQYLLRTVESVDGSEISYAVTSYDGAFAVGREYSLVEPGEGFVVRNWHSGDVVHEIAPLVPGTYLIAATVTNRETGKEAPAVTYFLVGE